MFSAFFRSLKQEFAGYNSKKLLADMMAGLTVCAVALPLALAFGVSSGASAASGLVTAIIAGVVIAILGGASYQISGPTGAMSAVLVGIVAEYGLQGVFFACFAAGVLLLLAGVFKLGRLISFIPMPVIMGFTSGIAIIIAMGQIDNFFGTVSEFSEICKIGLAFCPCFWYYTNRCFFNNNTRRGDFSRRGVINQRGGSSEWLNVNFVIRASCSAFRFPTLTAAPIVPGSPT